MPLARAIARLRSWRLDRRLADGADPSSSAVLAARAEQLMSRGYRDHLASRVDRTLSKGPTPSWGFAFSLNPAPEFEEASPALVQAATILRSSTPVSGQAVARLNVLLRDGESPLFAPKHQGELVETAERIVNALEGRPVP